MNSIFCSATTGAFYPEELRPNYEKAGTWPADAVKLTAAQHEALRAGLDAGKVIVPDSKGKPVLADPPPLTAEQVQAKINAEARAYLASTDWYVIRLQETGEPVPDDILAERAAARARVVE